MPLDPRLYAEIKFKSQMDKGEKLYEENDPKFEPVVDEDVEMLKRQILLLNNLFYRTAIPGLGMTLNQLKRMFKFFGFNYETYTEAPLPEFQGFTAIRISFPSYKNIIYKRKHIDDDTFSSGSLRVPLNIKELDEVFSIYKRSDEELEYLRKNNPDLEYIKNDTAIRIETKFQYSIKEYHYYGDEVRIFALRPSLKKAVFDDQGHIRLIN